MTKIDLRKKVRIHEVLAETLSAMSLREQDFEALFFLLAKLSKSHTDETIYNLDMGEFEALTGKKNNIVNYTATFKRLRATTLEIQTDKSILVDGIVSSAELIKGHGAVQVIVSPKMKPYLLNLTQGYTEHQLYSIIRLKSKHSKRYYLYFCNHRPKNGAFRQVLEWETIEDHKIKMGYDDEYKTNGNFINRILKVVEKEINELSNLRVKYNLKKRGREFYWIQWYIENKNNDELVTIANFSSVRLLEGESFKEKMNEKAFVIRLQDEYGLNGGQAEKVARMLERKALLNTLSKVDEARKKNEIRKSIGGYTRSVLLNDFGIELNI